ncbi:MAG: PH domain-containing protein [Chloroflexales bacterium]|nr:PH domain-containing protein [Chloroflexales bacterium]
MPISDWFRKRLELDAESSVELGSQEQIIHVTGRHYVVLLGRLVIPVLLLLLFGFLAFYRSIGGGFLVTETGAPTGFDPINVLLVGLMIALALAWTILWMRGKKTSRVRNIMVVAGLTIGLLAYFRYNGGRVFFIDQTMFGGQGSDLLNWLLIGLTAASLIAIIFIFYDWLNDELIVTNQRVIYDNDQVIIPRLLEQRVQQQIFLEDVQDVNTATKTYPQQWFGYGKIEVKSARFHGNIVFDAANAPQRMQKAIMDQVKALRKAATNQDYNRLVSERVYSEKAAAAPKPQLKTRTRTKETQAWRWLRRIVPENPEINEQTGQFVWRPHWLFLLRALLGPFTLLVGGLLIILIGTRLIALDAFWFTVATVALILWWLGWTAWEFEDYRNDMYILTPDKVIDIEKKPFGPEGRREAGLSQVNNVSSQTTYLSNLLGYGDVVLSTAGGGGSFTFNKVPRPADVVGLITEYNVRAKRADKYRPLNDTLELLKSYHEAQIQRDELNRPPA